jgi:LAO/AO transport system kinase
MLAGAGDELQGIKRGIMEMADGLLINKAEGENLNAAKRAQREYKNALHLFPPSDSEWSAKVELCSALEHKNMDGAWEIIKEYVAFTKENGFFQKQRQRQLRSWFIKTIDELLHRSLFSSKNLKAKLRKLEVQVEQKQISPYEAAKVIFEEFKRELKD